MFKSSNYLYLKRNLNPKNLFAHWKNDLISGFIVAIVALPLALGFAIASGAPPETGLYTAIITGIIASLLGGSSVQVTGPTGAMAVILIDIVNQYGLDKIFLISLLAGLIQLTFGILRLGSLAKYIPYSVLSGFTNGIAIVIFFSQLNNFLGLELKGENNFLNRLIGIISHINEINIYALGLGILSLFILIFWRKINKKIPPSIIVLIIAVLIIEFFKFPIKTVGAIPQSLPIFQGVPFWNDFSMIQKLMSAAMAIAALGSIESLLSALAADSMTPEEKHHSNQELIGQGLGNIIISFFGGIPGTGAIARTAVNIKSGAKTRLSGIFHGLFLLIFVIFLTPLVSKIPLTVLSAILMYSAYNMFEWESITFLRKTATSDLLVMLITILITVFFDLILAVQIGLLMAGIIFIKHMSDPHLIRMDNERTAKSGISDEISKQIAIYRMEGPLFFGAIGQFMNLLENLPDVKNVILRMRFINQMDASAIIALKNINTELKKRNIRLILTTLRKEVKTKLIKSGILDEIKEENCFNSTQEALENIAHIPHIERNY